MKMDYLLSGIHLTWILMALGYVESGKTMTSHLLDLTC